MGNNLAASRFGCILLGAYPSQSGYTTLQVEIHPQDPTGGGLPNNTLHLVGYHNDLDQLVAGLRIRREKFVFCPHGKAYEYRYSFESRPVATIAKYIIDSVASTIPPASGTVQDLLDSAAFALTSDQSLPWVRSLFKFEDWKAGTLLNSAGSRFLGPTNGFFDPQIIAWGVDNGGRFDNEDR